MLGWVALAQGVTVLAQELPQTVYVWTYGTTSQNIMMAGLAGIVNRNTNGEMLLSPIYNSSLPHPVFWLNQLKAAYPQVQSQFGNNPTFFINRYRTMLSGYVLYDRAVNPHSINMATSIAGVTNAIIVEPATLSYATAAGLPMITDARYMTYSQVYTQYGSQFNKNMLFHLDPARGDTLRDYAIQNRGFVYYTDPTALNPYAANQNHQGRIYGWGPSEFDLFFQASQNNQQVVASDFSWSSSTTSKWRVPLATQQYHAPGNVTTQSDKHYVAFVMSDGDNVQVLTNSFATDPRWFGSPYRGSFNMTWDFSPTLGEMSPVAFNYYYQHASNGAHKDNFVSAGGAGLTFPSQYPEINGLTASISQSMHTADHKVISVLDSFYDTSKLYPILDDPQVMGMMFKTYCCYYKGCDGALEFHNGKPILSVKYSLWDGADTALSIANALNNSTHRDGINDPASYSIVNVHPWSTSGSDGTGTGTPMGNLNQLVQWLDSNKVEVVTLEELMVHLRNNFGTPLANSPPVAVAGADAEVECTSAQGTFFLLDGSASSDPDSSPGTNDDIVAFEWFQNFGMPTQTLLGSGETLPVTLPLGQHRITLRVTDSQGEMSTDEVIMTIADRTPPVLLASLSRTQLWPPNHRLVPVSASVAATDICDPSPAVALVSIASSEPEDAPGTGDGDTLGDIQDAAPGTADLVFSLRAERAGAGGGRLYTVTYAASDASGNATTGTASVSVPHDQGGVVEPVMITAEEPPAGTLLRWSEVEGALSYTVVRGSVGSLRLTETAIDLGETACIEAASTDATTSGDEDDETPAPGEVFIYMVEYRDGAGSSSYGTEGVAKPRAATSGGCQ